MEISLVPRWAFVRLLYIICALLLLNITGLVSTFYFGNNSIYGLIPFFYFGEEQNIPTFYSSFSLLLASALLFVIALIHKKNGSVYISWAGLALVFLFLSVDEFAGIHERISPGFHWWAWVIPYSAGLVLFVAVYLRFLMGLPRNIMYLFIISGVVYVSGALGFEVLAGVRWELMQGDMSGAENMIYPLLTTCEEFLEMLGVAIFIFTLLTYMSDQFESITITFNQE